MHNNWILINSQQSENYKNTSKTALETFEMFLNEAYILPESNVFLFVKIDDQTWEIWEGFKVSLMEKLKVYKHGTVSKNELELITNSVSLRTNLQGITLKATTVVSDFFT